MKSGVVTYKAGEIFFAELKVHSKPRGWMDSVLISCSRGNQSAFFSNAWPGRVDLSNQTNINIIDRVGRARYVSAISIKQRKLLHIKALPLLFKRNRDRFVSAPRWTAKAAAIHTPKTPLFLLHSTPRARQST